MEQRCETVNLVEFWAYHLQFSCFNTSTGWGLSYVFWKVQGGWYLQSKLSKILCTGHKEFGTNRCEFLSKAKHFLFKLCRICEFMMCILIVNHQFNRMHPWCSWEGMLPRGCSPGKRCHTFWNRDIMLLPGVLGKKNCVPDTTLHELYGVKF